MRTVCVFFIIILSQCSFGQGFQWANSFGTAAADYTIKIQADQQGNVFAAGAFSGTMDVDPGPNVANVIAIGSQDVFITKWSSNGSLLWAKSFGGFNPDYLDDLEMDVSGDIYLTGSFRGNVDFDPGPTAYSLTALNAYDIYVLKLNNSGDFVYAKLLTGTAITYSNQIIVDDSKNLILAGSFSDVMDFDPGIAQQTIGASDIDNFILKLDALGNFVWVKTSSGNGSMTVADLTSDKEGSIIFCGTFTGDRDMDPGATTFSLHSSGSEDAFVCKLDSNGNFKWALNTGGINIDRGISVRSDYNNNVYYTGTFSNTTIDLDPGSASQTYSTSSGFAAYICKLDPDGNFAWADVFSQSFFFISCLKVETSGVYFTGRFIGGEDLDPGIATDLQYSNGSFDAIIMKLDFYGNRLWYKTFGSWYSDMGTSISVDNQNNCYVAGSFSNTCDFDPDTASTSSLYATNGDLDFFIVKLKEYDVFVKENAKDVSLSVFPNPSSGKLTIEGSVQTDKIEVFDMIGRKVKQTMVSDSSVDLGEIENGTYFLRLSSVNESIIKKIIIQR